jgi:hypothetical protein
MHAYLLVMVMKGRHPENAAAFPEFFSGVFEVRNLKHHRKILHKKDSA